jgi:iron complex outermembrane recepter protein
MTLFQRVFLSVLAVFVLNTTFAQQKAVVNGVVLDNKNRVAIELATVTLLKQDSSIASGTFTDTKGIFQTDPVAFGKYILKISMLGFETHWQQIELNQKELNVESVLLKSAENQLGEATVTATKNVYTKNAEKAVFNVAQSPVNQIGTLENVLQNMPGVTLDQNGNISIVGKSGVIVLVDDRPSPLASANLSAFLKSIPANSIESIELITNPSAKYQAEGNAGIINIKLKKGKADGFNMSATLSYGTIIRTNDNFIFNYKKNKFNLFGTYAFNYSQYVTEYYEIRKLLLDSTSYYNMHSPSDRTNNNHSVKAGFDYEINKSSSLTYTANFNANISKEKSNSYSNFMNSGYDITNQFYSMLNGKATNYTITNDIAYRKNYDSSERSLSMSLTHSYLRSRDDVGLLSDSYGPKGEIIPNERVGRNTYSKSDINNIIFQLDYTQPFGPGEQKIETGLRNETTFNINNFNVFNNLDGKEVPDTLLTNKFNYTENINAFYLMYGASVKEFLTISAGLRAEHAFIKSNSSNVQRNYLSLFPTFSLGFNISEAQSISLAYDRRIDRPMFEQINNAVRYYDLYTTWQGNPYLRPAFFNNLSLNYSLMIKEKHMINMEVGTSLSKDQYTETSFLNGDTKLSRGSVVNGTNGTNAYFELYSKFKLTKWWDFQMNNNVYYNRFAYREGLNREPASGVNYSLWLSTDFKFWKNAVFSINGWFNTGDVSFQGKSKAVGVLNASLKKSFLKDKLTVALSGNNILETMKWRWNTSNFNLETYGSWQNYSRAFFVSITYLFGKSNDLKRNIDKSNSRLSGKDSR